MKTNLLKSKISCFLCFVLILFFAKVGYSQEDEVAKYPNRPITFIFPYAAGVTSELAFRLVTKEAEKFLGQPIVIVNKVGGGGTVGVAALAAAKPDGYTIGQNGTSASLVTPFFEKLPYHPVKDFKQIVSVKGNNFGVVVKADSSFKTFKDIIAFARQNPKKVTYGTAGAKNMNVFILDQIAKKEKVEFTIIPYKATSESEMALLGGHIHFAAGDYTHSLIEAGQIRLVVILREERSVEYPDVPIIGDLGYDIVVPWFGSVACPRGVPDGIVKKLEEAFTKAMKEPAFIKGMKELRDPIVYRNSKEMNEYVARGYSYMEKMLKDLGYTK